MNFTSSNTQTRRLLLLLLAFSSSLLCTLPAAAQNQPGGSLKSETAKDETKPYATLFEYSWSDKGALILGVRIHAGSKQPLALKAEGAKDSGMDSPAFTLQSSYLTEKHTQEKILPLPDLPSKPNYGPSATFTTLMPSGWMQLGVAFPRPATPPKEGQGKQPDFILELHLPNHIQPVSFTVPYVEAPSGTAPKTQKSP